MMSAKPSSPGFLFVTLTVGLLAAFTTPMQGQDRWRVQDPLLQQNIADWTSQGRGVPEDWSHRHLIYSDPGTEEDAIRNGTHDHWLSIVNDPRYIVHRLKRSRDESWKDGPHGFQKREPKTGGLWGESLGTGATVGAGQYPAKYSFYETTPTLAVNCAGGTSPDYVVFNTSLAGSSGQASIGAFDNLYSGTCTSGSVPETYWAYNTGGTVALSVVISPTGSQVAFMQLETITMSKSATATATGVALTINGVAGYIGSTTITSPVVTLTSGTVGSASVGKSISGTGIPGTTTVGSITSASLNLLRWKASATETFAAPVAPTPETSANYFGCTAPCSVSIPFTTAANDTKSAPYYDYTSDTLYVGDDTGVLHKFAPVFNATTPVDVPANGWPVTVSTGNILLPPVYDSTSTLVFVAANNTGASPNSGYLYSVTTTGSSSQTVVKSGEIARHTAISDAPIVDSTSGKVYVFTANDSDSQPTSFCGSEGGNDACAAVWQLPTTFGSGVAGNESTMGIAAQANQAPIMFAGTFDNTFYGGNGTSGNLYVCGYAITGTVPAQTVASLNLYQIPVSTWPNAATNIGAITSASTTCSPLTEIYNPRTLQGTVNNTSHTVTATTGTFTAADVGATISGTGISSPAYITTYTSSTQVTVSGTTANEATAEPITVGDDWVYASVDASGSATGCTSGACLYGYDVARGTFTNPVVARSVSGGTSGITLDNTGTGGGSQLYFTYIGPATVGDPCPAPSSATTGSCALQVSQSSLN